MIILIRKKKLFKIIISILIIVLMLFVIFIFKSNRCMKVEPCDKSYVAIVIDDFGNSGDGTEEMLNLGIPLTAAVMPFLEKTKVDVENAHENGLEVILHLPMQPMKGKKSWLGPRGITTDLTDEQVEERVVEGLEEVKYAKGINNHMGSKAMTDNRIVEDVMNIAKRNNLFFLDSKTTAKCDAEEICKKLQVTYFKRDIFLDNIKEQYEIEKQLDKVADKAIEQGYAIAIGHVGEHGGTVTAKAIKNKYKDMQKRGIEFISLSKLRNMKKIK